MAQQSVRIFVIQRIDTDPDAGAYRDGFIFDGDRLGYRREQAFKCRHALFTLFQPQQQHHKLVPAQTGNGIAAAYGVLDALGHLDQYLVACSCPKVSLMGLKPSRSR